MSQWDSESSNQMLVSPRRSSHGSGMRKGLSLIIPQGHGQSESKLFLASPPLGSTALNKDRHRNSTQSNQAVGDGPGSLQLPSWCAERCPLAGAWQGCPAPALQPSHHPSTRQSPSLPCHCKTSFARGRNVCSKHISAALWPGY